MVEPPRHSILKPTKRCHIDIRRWMCFAKVAIEICCQDGNDHLHCNDRNRGSYYWENTTHCHWTESRKHQSTNTTEYTNGLKTTTQALEAQHWRPKSKAASMLAVLRHCSGFNKEKTGVESETSQGAIIWSLVPRKAILRLLFIWSLHQHRNSAVNKMMNLLHQHQHFSYVKRGKSTDWVQPSLVSEVFWERIEKSEVFGTELT